MSKFDFLVPEQRFTPSQDIAIWRERMRYTQREAAEAIGCSLKAFQLWETGVHRAPRYIGLAMAALSKKLQPWRPSDRHP